MDYNLTRQAKSDRTSVGQAEASHTLSSAAWNSISDSSASSRRSENVADEDQNQDKLLSRFALTNPYAQTGSFNATREKDFVADEDQNHDKITKSIELPDPFAKACRESDRAKRSSPENGVADEDQNQDKIIKALRLKHCP